MTTCAEIRDRLPEYASGRLEDTSAALVEAHCVRCAACASERDWLLAYYRELWALGEIKAPDDFLAKVRACLERSSSWTRIVRGIFLPVKTKIPFELAGVAATVVFLLAVFHLVRPAAVMERPVPAPALAATPALKMAAEEAPLRQEVAAPPAEARAPRRRALEMKMAAADRLLAGRERKGKPAIAAHEVKAVSRLAMPPAKAEQREDQGVIELALLLPPREVKPAVASETEDALDRETARGAGVKKKTRACDRTAEAFTAPERRAAGEAATVEPEDRVRVFVESVGGTIVQTDLDEATGLPGVLVAEVPARSYPGLLTALARVGELRGTPQPVAPGENGTVRVRILCLRSR